MRKIIITVLLLHTIVFSYSQTISRKLISSAGGYYSGTDFSVSYSVGETMINTLSSGNTILTQGFQQPEDLLLAYTLTLKAFLEGFYRGGEMMEPTLYNLGMSSDPTATDMIQVDLWSPDHLQNNTPDLSTVTLLHTDGTASVSIPEVPNENNYYISLKHRNSLETWSAAPVDMSQTALYDFTNEDTKAFGNGINSPMKNLETNLFGIFSGENTGDGTIDINDMSVTENDAFNFQYGYNNTDCNGDGASDALDMQIIENNAILQLYMARPL